MQQASLPFPQVVDEETQRRFDEAERFCQEQVAKGIWNRLAFTKSEWKRAGRDPLLWKDATYIDFPNGGRVYAFIEAPSS